MTNRTPERPKLTSRPLSRPTEKVALRKSWSGSIGPRTPGSRRSTMTKPIAAATPMTSAMSTGADIQPSGSLWMTPNVRPARASTAQQLARQVDGTVRVARHARREGAGDQHAEQGDRHIDDEDEAPAERVRQDTADDRSRGERDTGDGGPGSECPGPLGGVGVGSRDDGHGGGQQGGARDAEDTAHADQNAQVRGGSGESGGDEEGPGAGQEDLAGAEAVGERTHGEQQRGEGEGVPVDDPLEPGEAAADIIADGGQCHVHHAGVEQHHEVAERKAQKQEPLAPDPGLGLDAREAPPPCAAVTVDDCEDIVVPFSITDVETVRRTGFEAAGVDEPAAVTAWRGPGRKRNGKFRLHHRKRRWVGGGREMQLRQLNTFRTVAETLNITGRPSD